MQLTHRGWWCEEGLHRSRPVPRAHDRSGHHQFLVRSSRGFWLVEKTTDWEVHWSIAVTPGRLRGPILATPEVCIEDLHADPLQLHHRQVTWADTYGCLGRCRGHALHWLRPLFSDGDDSVLLGYPRYLKYSHLSRPRSWTQVHLHSTAISMRAWHTRPRAHGILYGDLLSGHQRARHLLSVCT